MDSLSLESINAFKSIKEISSDQRKVIIDRLLANKHQRYLKSIEKINTVFDKFCAVNPVTNEPIYADPKLSQWVILLDAFLASEDFIDKDKASKHAQEIKNYAEKIQQIHEASSKLADLLRIAELQREQINCSSDYALTIDQLIFDTIENTADASKKELFNCYIGPQLETLLRFDDRYWPSIQEVLKEMSRQTRLSQSYPWPTLPNQIHKKNSFLKVFFEHIKSMTSRQIISRDILSLSNEDWCWFFNAAAEQILFVAYDIDNFKKTNKSLF